MPALNETAAPNVIVFDDRCGFCQRQMAFIRRRDRAGEFAFVGASTPGLVERFPMLADADLMSGLRFIGRDGRLAQGADAVYEIARRLPFWRRWVWLYRIPGLTSLWRRLYGWIARNRMRLSGACESGVCRVPDR